MAETDVKHPESEGCGEGQCRCANDRRQKEADTSQPDFEERRTGRDRRENVVDRRLGLDRRRGPGRRRSEDRKAAEEGQMSDEQFEFVMAIDEYKRANARPFPTWTEVLDVIKALGYRRVAEPQPLAESQSTPSTKAETAKGGRRTRQPQLAK
jgi:hypothetical protein